MRMLTAASANHEASARIVRAEPAGVHNYASVAWRENWICSVILQLFCCRCCVDGAAPHVSNM